MGKLAWKLDMQKLQLESKNALEKKVLTMLLDEGTAEEIDSHIRNLVQHGCKSGMVTGLIYYSDTLAFFEEYKTEINELLRETMDSTGIKAPADLLRGWDDSDPLAQDTANQNLLAWFAYEEVVRNIANQLDMDV